jgi:hypothetical protein
MKVNNVNIHPNSWLCPKGYQGITLFGHVFTRMSKDTLEDYVKTYKGQAFVNHENIHCIQAKSFKTKWLEFYILYIFYWFKNLFKGNTAHKAYHNIPFEAEAYANEYKFDYTQTYWKNYR